MPARKPRGYKGVAKASTAGLTVKKKLLSMGCNFGSLADIDRQKALMLALPVRRKTQNIPWGYDWSEEQYLLIPDEVAMKALLHARKLLQNFMNNGCTLVSVTEWLAEFTQRPLSHKTLTHMLCFRYPLDEIALPLEERSKLMQARADLDDPNAHIRRFSRCDKERSASSTSPQGEAEEEA